MERDSPESAPRPTTRRGARLPAPAIVIDAADQPPVAQAGCGCQPATVLLVVPIVLGIVALLLMGPGPASADRWFLKGLLIGVGGLLTAFGLVLAPVAIAARSMTGLADSFEHALYMTAAAAASDETTPIAVLRGRIEAVHDHRLRRTPLSNHACPWWRLTVHRLGGPGSDNGHDWTVLHEETHASPFWLRDSSGRINVDPAGATITGITFAEREVYRAEGEEALRTLDGTLRAAGLTLDLTWSPETSGFSVMEEVLSFGTEVTIAGSTVARNGERVVAADVAGRLLTISAIDNLGIVSTVRRTARRLHIAAVVVPIAGVAMVGGGFWWILTG